MILLGLTSFYLNLAFILIVVLIYIEYNNRFKYSNTSKWFDYIKNNDYIKLVLKYIIPDKQSKRYRRVFKKIQMAYLKLTVEDFYQYKLFFSLFFLIFFSLVSYTNLTIRKSEIIKKFDYRDLVVLNESGEMVQVFKNNIDVVKVYKDVSSKFEKEIYTKQKEILEYEIAEYIKTKQYTDNLGAIYLADDMYNKMIKVSQLFSNKILLMLFLLSVFGFYIPDLFLIIYSKIKINKLLLELNDFESILLTVGSYPNITLSQILQILINSSHHFKETLDEFYKIYIINKSKAYSYISAITYNKEVLRFIDILRQIENSDRTIVLNNLKEKRQAKKEYRRNQITIETKKKTLLQFYYSCLY